MKENQFTSSLVLAAILTEQTDWINALVELKNYSLVSGSNEKSLRVRNQKKLNYILKALQNYLME